MFFPPISVPHEFSKGLRKKKTSEKANSNIAFLYVSCESCTSGVVCGVVDVICILVVSSLLLGGNFLLFVARDVYMSRCSQAFAWFSDLLVEHAEIFWSLFAVDMDAVLEDQPADTWDSFPLFQVSARFQDIYITY